MYSEVEVTGFTLCPDVLVKAKGAICALVYGRVVRYQQMGGLNGWCTASIYTLATETGFDIKTVRKWLDWLVNPDDGGEPYLEVQRFANKPSRYRATTRLTFKTKVSVEDSRPTKSGRATLPKVVGQNSIGFSTTALPKVVDKDIKEESLLRDANVEKLNTEAPVRVVGGIYR